MARRQPAREPVAVIGVGLKAPGGNSPDALWSSLGKASSTATPFVDSRLPAEQSVLVCRVTEFDASAYLSPIEQRRYDRVHHLALGAAQDAMNCVDGPVPAPHRCAVVCGTGLGASATYEQQMANLLGHGLRAMSPLGIPVVMPSSTASLISMRFGFTGPCHTVSAACASGALAIGEGVELIRRGSADLVVAGGFESLLTCGALGGFMRLDAMSRTTDAALASRPFDVDRDGFVMGEGAGFVVLEALSRSRAKARTVFGAVVGYGSTSDAHHLVAPDPSGAGARRCMAIALHDAGISPSGISHVNAHGTSTVLNDLAEARAITDLFGSDSPPVTAVKGTTGHLIGGSGAVEAIVTLRSLAAGVVPPVAGLKHLDPAVTVDVVVGESRRIGTGYGLSNSFGFGGVNTSLVLAGAAQVGHPARP
jgi:3-oxoacyl-[acyl-carrier-protein] synthase II